MSRSFEKTRAWEGALIESPFMKHVMRLVCCRDVDTDACREALSGMVKDAKSLDHLREVIFYLEHAGWNASEAFVQKELDTQDRRGPALTSDGQPVDNLASNPKVDRSFAKPGDKYDATLTKIKLIVNEKKQVFKYPHAKTIDPTSQADINALNRWRHRIFRENLGFTKYKAPNNNGTDYHPLQIDYLLNRYAEQKIDYRGRAKYEKITEDYNLVFTGIHLPGRREPCEARTKDSVTSLLTRKAVSPKEPDRKWPSSWNATMRHKAAQDRVFDEWMDRMEANDKEAEEARIAEAGEDNDDDDDENAGEDAAGEQDEEESSAESDGDPMDGDYEDDGEEDE